MQIKPIKDLRNTQEISELVHSTNDPIYITKNGYGDMVIMSLENYEKITLEKQKAAKINSDTLLSNYENDSLGYLNVCAVPLEIKVADVKFNANNIIKNVKDLTKDNQIILFPELSLTSYSCGDLFLNRTLKDSCIEYISLILKETKDCSSLFVFGAPIEKDNKLYNCAIVCFKGKILGIVPKTYLPNYMEFYEMRHFEKGSTDLDYVSLFDYKIPFSTNLLFQNALNPKEIIAIEICEDLWALNSPHIAHVNAGATIILNLSASNELISKEEYRKNLISYTSAKTISAYIYCSATNDESTTDLLFSGVSMICENGTTLSYSAPFENKITSSTIDLDYLKNERMKMTSFPKANCENYKIINYENEIILNTITREYPRNPFVPNTYEAKVSKYKKILKMQALGLAKRLKHTGMSKMVVGISGGLDSTLAYLVCVECADILNLPRKNIIAITLPCFGTSARTKNNAQQLAKDYDTTFIEISIKDSVTQHLKDINHDIDKKDTTFENAQARERTQVLMDYANQVNGLVIGTGDLSEIALGWSTYNGDHMSMYSVNSSLPKTLIKDMVYILADFSPSKKTLLDIVNTPVSPELLPADKKGNISQLTEDIVGPYELHDFFLYMFIRNHFSIKKIYEIAKSTFKDVYDEETIKKWLKNFIKRFFSQQFKRSCMPDGIKIGSVSLSPRGDWRMPSDASMAIYLENLEKIG